MKDCEGCLASKAVKDKPYSGFQSLLILTHHWKDLFIDFMTGLSISSNWEGKAYDFILIIVDGLTKIVYYKSVKITINASGLLKIIINVMVKIMVYLTQL